MSETASAREPLFLPSTAVSTISYEEREAVAAISAYIAVLSDAELDQHIEDTGRLMLAAYARFEQHGEPDDRIEAREWLTMRDNALARRHGYDLGCYFTACGAADRAAMEGRAA